MVKVYATQNIFEGTYAIGEVFKAEMKGDKFFKYNPISQTKEEITDKVEVF